MNSLYKLLPVILSFAFCVGCKKLVEVNPPTTDLVGASAFSSNSNAAAVLTGIYSSAVSGGDQLFTGLKSISAIGSLSSDELVAYDAFLGGLNNQLVLQAYRNSLVSGNSPIWVQLYAYIYKANAAVEGLQASTGVTADFKSQLTGEAKFIRAFCYFYLVNLFGDVPLITSTDYRINKTASRTSSEEVYQQIINDLKDAQNLLSEDYLDATHTLTFERVRPNKFVATALLARVYLYRGDWVNSESESSTVIATPQFALNDLNDVFLMNSQEAIWQLPPVAPEVNTFDGYYFTNNGAPNFKTPVSLSESFVQSFEPGDNRIDNWITTVVTTDNDTFYYPFKYKVIEKNQPISEYLMIFRLAEQYLIRAEARAQQDNVSGAQEDLDVIRWRAGLAPTAAHTKAELVLAIENERHAELFTEWGHRWLDLKRRDRLNDVMSQVAVEKGVEWNTNKQLFPISISDIQANPNLTQNPGYN
jgi:starch-binding outer membrane protein, SusD/RagB family